MIISIFNDVYSAVDPQNVFDLEWDDARKILGDWIEVSAKTDTKLFNLWDFKLDKTQAVLRQTDYKISRCAENTLGLWGLVLDFDNMDADSDKALTIDKAQEQYADYEYVLYTTYRHLYDGRTHKFRMIIPFSERLETHVFKAKKQSLLSAFKAADMASFSASQAFYLHSGDKKKAYTHYNSGKFIDLTEYTDAPPPQMYIEPAFKRPSSSYTETVLACLSRVRGLHYEEAMNLANIVKSSGGGIQDYFALCGTAFAVDSSHRTKSEKTLISEFERAYKSVKRDTINAFLSSHGAPKLPTLCRS